MIESTRFNRDTIAFFLHKRATTCSADIAYSFSELHQHYSWETIWNEAQLIANGLLQLGIKKGDPVVLLMTGRMELIVSMFAVASIGAIIVPLNSYSKKDEVRSYLQSARPAAMIIGKEGHHLNYPSMLMEIISDCNNDMMDCPWLPAHIFVIDGDSQLPSPLRPFTHLLELAAHTDEDEFIRACKLVNAIDPLILLYTSGTLGTPKGVLRTTASFLTSSTTGKEPGIMTTLLQKSVDRIARHFTIMNLLPLYHLGGFGTIFTNLRVCNVRIAMLTHFNPLQAMKVVELEACRVLVGTPYMVHRILASAQGNLSPLSSLIGISFTSASVSHSLIQRVKRELRLLFFMVTYGSSETGSVANGTCFVGGRRNLLLSLLFKLLTRSHFLSGVIDYKRFEHNNFSLAGKVDRGVEVKILNLDTGDVQPNNEHGEVAVRSHRVMRYLQENQHLPCFTHDGWYKTGDVGFLDDNRILTIAGRLHRQISRGGEKISPVEIESLILLDNEVEEAFVLGIPDDLYEEQVCACIVTKEGSNLTAQSVRDSVSAHLSAFKVPHYVIFLPELPLSPTGKISVIDIRMLVLNQLGKVKQHA